MHTIKVDDAPYDYLRKKAFESHTSVSRVIEQLITQTTENTSATVSAYKTPVPKTFVQKVKKKLDMPFEL